MASLTVSEYEDLQDGPSFPLPITDEPAAVDQTAVAVGGGSLQSAAFGANTKVVCITTDANCRWQVGLNPTAGTNSKYLAAGGVISFGVRPGHKVAVIAV